MSMSVYAAHRTISVRTTYQTKYQVGEYFPPSRAEVFFQDIDTCRGFHTGYLAVKKKTAWVLEA